MEHRESTILNALLCYMRWRAEGSLPHHSNVSWGHKGPKQYYYDPYHNSISYDQETGRYSYHIQVSDSPEGDTWVRGSFKLQGAFRIEDHVQEPSTRH